MSLTPLTLNVPLAVAFVGSAAGATSATLPAHEAGDLIIAFSFRRGGLTAPTLPAGWTNLDAKAEAGGATNISARAAYRIATDGSTTTGTWTNATHTTFTIYRNAALPLRNPQWRQGSATGVELANLGGTLERSWVAAFATHANVVDYAFVFNAVSWPIRESEDTPGTLTAGDTGAPTGGGLSGGVNTVFTADSWITLRVEVPAADGEEVLRSYTLPPRTRPRARRPERLRSGAISVRGDALETPNPLVVMTEVPGATLADAYANAYDLVQAAEGAASVRTHEGDQAVQALLGYSMNPLPSSVQVTLRWAPAGPTITPLTPLAYASETSPTVDSTLPTADTYWTPA